MDTLSVWIASVVGVAVITVLADIVLPQGQTRKYVKSVLSVVVVFVLAQPLPYVFSGKFNYTFLENTPYAQVDEAFIASVSASRRQLLTQSVRQGLDNNGYDDLQFELVFDSSAYSVEYVLLSFDSKVISTEQEHNIVNESEVVLYLCSLLCISREQIIICTT